MTIHLISTNQVSTKHGVKLCVYGRAGVGKTRLCATAPNPIIISAESGLLSLRQFNLPVIEVHNYKELTEAYNWVMSSNEANQFWTVCLDSVTEISEIILVEEKLRNRDKRAAYGETLEQSLALLRKFRDMPNKHVYFAAKQYTDTGMNSPMMPGKQLPLQIPYFFDEVFQLIVGKDDKQQEFRALRCKPDLTNDAKDRSGVLSEWEPADLNYIINKIMQGTN